MWGGDCYSFAACTFTLQVIGSSVYRSMTIPTDFLVVVLSPCTHIQVSQELMSVLRDLIPELMLSQKTSYTHGSNSQRFRSYEFIKYSK